MITDTLWPAAALGLLPVLAWGIACLLAVILEPWPPRLIRAEIGKLYRLLKGLRFAAVLLGLLIGSPAYADQNGLDSRSGLDLPIGAGGTTHLTLHADSDLTTVKGQLQLGNTNTACGSANAGALRYNGSIVQFCNGSSWSVLGGTVLYLSYYDIPTHNGSYFLGAHIYCAVSYPGGYSWGAVWLGGYAGPNTSGSPLYYFYAANVGNNGVSAACLDQA